MPHPRSFVITIPDQRYIDVVGPPRREFDHTGALFHMPSDITVAQLQGLQGRIQSQVAAVNAAIASCAGISPADKTAWRGVYEQWQASDAQWSQVVPSLGVLTDPLGTGRGQYWDDMNGMLVQVNQWQDRVSAQCGNISPPPKPPEPPNGGGSGDWATAIKWVAILGLAGLTLYFVGPVVAAAAAALAGGIRRRTEGAAEFLTSGFGNTDRMREQFGNMPRNSVPMVEPLQFGDVPREEILKIVRG